MNYHLTQNKVVFFTRPAFWISLFLIAATLVVYWQVQNHDFINYDDTILITDNRLVQTGLTLKSITAAFKPDWDYWKPLTFLSFMLDYEIYGLASGGFQTTNVLFHIANSLLLFVLLRMTTGATWQSGFVATLFALHPLHVESVAWVTERKDVLSTFFWMLTILAYVHYLKRPDFKRYLLILVVLSLGLMAKPMLVTLPFVLLLIDYWPLGRLRLPQKRFKSNKKAILLRNRSLGNEQPAFPIDNSTNSSHLFIGNLSRLILEKIPMFFFVAAASWMVLSARASNPVIQPYNFLSFGYRTSNALISYVKYIEKMFWPQALAIPYPFTSISWQETAVSFLILLCISVAAVKTLRSRPYFAVGWLWFLGTLVPVSGVVYVGEFAMADRFTYVPLIGLFIIIAWGVSELLAQWKYKQLFLGLLTAALMTTLMAMTWKQVGYWKNSITLFRHTLEVTTNNAVAQHNLASALDDQDQTAEAIVHYTRALRIRPESARTNNNLGVALVKQDRIDEAIEHYSKALRTRPGFADAYNNLGVARQKQGRTGEAIGHYLKALQIKPDHVDAHNNLGIALAKEDRIDEAIEHFSKAIRLAPEYVKAHNNLGIALVRQDRIDEAIEHYSTALRIEPEFAEAYNNLGLAREKQGRTAEAIDYYRQALQIKPDYATALKNLARAREKQGRTAEAIDHYLQALRINPDFAEAHNNLGRVLAKQNRIDQAVEHYLTALRIEPDYAEAHNNLGVARYKQGRTAQAIDHYLQALRIAPDYAVALNNLASALYKQGRTAEAITRYRHALRINPDLAEAHNNLGMALVKQDRIDEAIDHYSKALRIDPDYVEAHNNLGIGLVKQDRIDKAVEHYSTALRINPDYVDVHNNLGVALFRKGDIERAIVHFRTALRLKPDHLGAKNNLRKVLMMRGQKDD